MGTVKDQPESIANFLVLNSHYPSGEKKNPHLFNRFPVKIESFRYDLGLSSLFFSCDERRRTKKGRPRGGSKGKTPARRASERPWGGDPS
jgi:hypothetical protein